MLILLGKEIIILYKIGNNYSSIKFYTMKKVFYYLMLTSTIISGFAFIYEFINIGEATSFKLIIGLFFECTISGVITILLEDRPRDTDIQRRVDDKVKNQGFGILIMLFALVMVALVASSCSPKTGYGCHGRSKIMTRVQ